MDSLSQIVLGGAVAAACVPAAHRRAAWLAGAALGTLPDLDAPLIAALTPDPVLRMTLHRGASHSLFVLPLLAWGIWWLLRRRGGRVAQAPRAWLWAIMLALITHPLLDAFTVYGTQLLWPLPVHPAMWSSVFIIDPLYTVPLLLASAAVLLRPQAALARQAVVAGLVLSTAYLGWSLAAKAVVERAADAALAPLGLADAPRFSTPMPLNTVLWRVVVMTPQGYWVGDRSVLADRGPMRFAPHTSAVADAQAVAGFAAVQQLTWFNRGFMRAQVRDLDPAAASAPRQQLVLSDLRMGLEPHYSFNFAVAQRTAGGAWQPLQPPVQLGSPADAAFSRQGMGAALRGIWQRMWHAPGV
ncbi:MAG: metal-dependent hydrolase [Pseudomonadota bacterium]|nr:metal-dependent hydrolase [Pseudomonadota bacterium]